MEISQFYFDKNIVTAKDCTLELILFFSEFVSHFDFKNQYPMTNPINAQIEADI